jgi:hypothetical protein
MDAMQPFTFLMPRYFFSECSNGNRSVDEEGAELRDLAAAKREAELSLREMLAEAIKLGDESRLPDELVVLDAQGNEVHSITVRDILPKRCKP